MIYEMTIQIRVTDMQTGQAWYETLLKRQPDFVPHEGFAEWELLPGCWLQVAEGTRAAGSGPLRLGVNNLDDERERIMRHLQVEHFEIHSRSEVPVRWATFTDPWGNRLGLFEYHNEEDKAERMRIC
ncbi:VOC family protein [Paenibacillus sp. EC2-1]|uniref:VOC family protein n=1 Tax=Paenibacillus sp. EC2-1 TaxID=3388665 RepID=UPI003BEEB1C5